MNPVCLLQINPDGTRTTCWKRRFARGVADLMHQGCSFAVAEEIVMQAIIEKMKACTCHSLLDDWVPE